MTYSIVKGDLKTLDILLGAGADISEADGNGMTPLMVAASIGAEQKVAFLIQRDADVTLQDNEGKTALHKTDANKVRARRKDLVLNLYCHWVNQVYL